MTKILTIVGARPQIIKAAAFSRALERKSDPHTREVLLHTGQHYDKSMSEVFFEEMGIPRPAYNLGIGSRSHGAQTGDMLHGIEEVILKEKPDGVMVYGDTNSTLAGGLAAAKLHIPVIHVEAGLRSFNKRMPEEINRIACDHLSTLLFSPTRTGVENLKREGIVHHPGNRLSFDRQGVYHCGDVMFDNTLFFREMAIKRSDILRDLGLREGSFLLGTIHRPANTDRPETLRDLLQALATLARESGLEVVLPLHPRTRHIIDSDPGFRVPDDGLRIVPPVSFLDMIRLEAASRLILTDSGGVQKEAWFMEKPVVVLREETEWVEIVEEGNGALTGADPEAIHTAATRFLENPPSEFPPIFGNGRAAEDILQVLEGKAWLP
ncbi:MAG: UDP-N-acetylglucosamine 2-epimerase (non-hydrolyzing) [Bacteroidales bacterium]